MSSLELAIQWCRQHSFCVILMLTVVLIAVIVVMGGDDKDLVSHVSLGGALVGGMLAIFVLFYTLLDSSDVRTNLTEMKGLIADVKGETVKTSGEVSQIMNNMRQYLSDEDKSESKTEKTNEHKILVLKRRSILVTNYAIGHLTKHGGRSDIIQILIGFRNELLKDIKTDSTFISKISGDIANVDALVEDIAQQAKSCS